MQLWWLDFKVLGKRRYCFLFFVCLFVCLFSVVSMFVLGDIISSNSPYLPNLPHSSNSPLCWYLCLELSRLHFGLWQIKNRQIRRIRRIRRFVGTLVLSLFAWRSLAKYCQIRHFRHCLHFWTYLPLPVNAPVKPTFC